ncbi:methylated-DNA--[protein]-cysteine S-methyltransferase [Nocardiopsis sp. N85]|uniref:methylated-DNA--[protein]-cysteine S-methyltransferase n=1 Tax=Nocardiopsis sp. N85 TaxID=3029400 RepID=UPI00406D383D
MNTDMDMLPFDIEMPAPARGTPVVLMRPTPGPTRYTTMDSPLGELTLYGDGKALGGVLTPAKDGRERHVPTDWIREDGDTGVLADAITQLRAYFTGELRDFDLPLAPAGTDWQRQVWSALTTIPYGETAGYGELAREIGRPTASRAVGMANGRNPISIIVPCHRVIGADGTLTGYAGGLERKRFLLALESRGA